MALQNISCKSSLGQGLIKDDNGYFYSPIGPMRIYAFTSIPNISAPAGTLGLYNSAGGDTGATGLLLINTDGGTTWKSVVAT